jgi:uncharacterized tellurite resistance protein B-like protein
MIARIKALFDGRRDGAIGTDTGVDDLHLAAAALLVEAAVMDGTFDDDERRTIDALLQGSFDLDGEAAAGLIELAESAVAKSSQHYGFARVVKDNFSHDERVRMIEMLWEVAYADGHLHDFEASYMRRIAGLIYVPDRESGAARKRVRDRLAIPAGT